MNDFTLVEDGSPLGGFFICKHCNSRVERGIVSVSNHWVNCVKNTKGLIIARNECERKFFNKLCINKQNES